MSRFLNATDTLKLHARSLSTCMSSRSEPFNTAIPEDRRWDPARQCDLATGMVDWKVRSDCDGNGSVGVVRRYKAVLYAAKGGHSSASFRDSREACSWVLRQYAAFFRKGEAAAVVYDLLEK